MLVRCLFLLLLVCSFASGSLNVVALGVDDVAPLNPLSLVGKYWYHDRDQKVPRIPATITCVALCDDPLRASYKATLSGVSALVFGVVNMNSKFVGFGAGPTPQLIGGCQNGNFTVFIENDNRVGNIFAAYSPCNQFKGGASIYTKNTPSLFTTLKNNLLNDIKIMEQVKPFVSGQFLIHDRNFASLSSPLSFTCVSSCQSATPTYRGTFDKRAFTVTFAPDGLVAFGEIDVLSIGAPCGKTDFTVVVPPKGMANGAIMLAAARPNPRCSYQGQAFRIAKQ